MLHTRIKLFVEVDVDLDDVSGWGDNPTDHVNSLRSLIETRWNTHYSPKFTMNYFDTMFKVTHGDEEWVFVDKQAAIDKQAELLKPLLESLFTNK